MKIKLTDGTMYEISDIKIDKGVLFIDFRDKTAEEVQAILSVPGNLNRIELLNDNEKMYAYYSKYSVFAGVYLNPDTGINQGMLTQEKDEVLSRLTEAESAAKTATTTCSEVSAKMETFTEEQKVAAEEVKQQLQSFQTNLSDMSGTLESTNKSLEAVSESVGDATTVASEAQKLAQSASEAASSAENLAENISPVAMISKTVCAKLAQDFEDEDAIAVKYIYPNYADLIGKTVKLGYKMIYQDVLYKTIQDNLLIQAQYVPGEIGTESLYTVLDEIHEGTSEDPIPYSGNMELINEKYYTQDGVKYRCTRGTEQPVYHPLSALVGLYVEVVA